MGSWKKRGDYSYRLTVSQGYDSDGKKLQRQKTIHLPEDLTQKQIEKELTIQIDRFEKEVQRGTYLDGTTINLNEFAEKWMKDYAEVSLRPKTLNRYKQLLKRILAALGHKKLNSLQPIHLIEFYKNLGEHGVRLDYVYKLKENVIETMPDFTEKVSVAEVNPRTIKQVLQGRTTTKAVADKLCTALNKPIKKVFDVVDKEKKLSSLTISHHHKLISAMLTTAVQWQLIVSNPAERVKPPKVDRKEAKYYDVDEVNQMLALLENEPIKYKVMVYIVIFCGLRLGELSNLEWSDVDFKNETISISKQLQYLPGHGIYEMDTAKTESGNRTISIPSTLVELLSEYKEWQDNEKVIWGNEWVESNKLFTKEKGEPIFPDTPSQWFRKFIKQNNLPPLTFHQLRHTNASILIGQGVDVATVAGRLGHADKSVTLKVYAHAIKRQDREAVNKLQDIIKPKT